MPTSDPVIQTVTVTSSAALKNYYELFVGSESGPVPAFPPYEATWDGFHLKLGTWRMWVDAAGTWRVKNGAPTSETDGTPLAAGAGGAEILTLDAGDPVPPGTPAGTVILRLA